MQRVRVHFSKDGPMRFTSHLDLVRAWERTLRRAGAPTAHTKGYHPKPRLNLAAALPLGFTSECELTDIWLEEPVPHKQLLESIISAAPPGLTVHSVTEVELKDKSLQSQLTGVVYRITTETPDDLATRIGALLAAVSVPRVRRDKQYDLRPLVDDVWLGEKQEEIFMRLTARPGKTGRPDEVLLALGLDPLTARIHRTKLVFEDSGG